MAAVSIPNLARFGVFDKLGESPLGEEAARPTSVHKRRRGRAMNALSRYKMRVDDNEIRVFRRPARQCHWHGFTRTCLWDLALSKSVESGSLSLNSAVLRWMPRKAANR
jgi:hypothetical protein